jgi:hypothetical protein
MCSFSLIKHESMASFCKRLSERDEIVRINHTCDYGITYILCHVVENVKLDLNEQFKVRHMTFNFDTSVSRFSTVTFLTCSLLKATDCFKSFCSCLCNRIEISGL